MRLMKCLSSYDAIYAKKLPVIFTQGLIWFAMSFTKGGLLLQHVLLEYDP